ncbi:MAG: hypothetical protein V2B18_16695, partial [Pseudomonadota bacterium]
MLHLALIQGIQCQINHIIDMGEVPDLLTVAVDLDGAVLKPLPEPDRQNPTFQAVVLPRPVDVEISEHLGPEPMEVTLERPKVLLAGQLRNSVIGPGPELVNVIGCAVDR